MDRAGRKRLEIKQGPMINSGRIDLELSSKKIAGSSGFIQHHVLLQVCCSHLHLTDLTLI